MIWESKVKTLRNHMKIISEWITWPLTLNPEDLNKSILFKYANCVQNLNPEFYFSITKTKYIPYFRLLFTLYFIFA